MEVNIREAKTHFLRLLQQVESGEEIIIVRGGKPVARLVPVVSSRAAAQGMDRGRVWIADDFDAPNPELEALFEDTAPKKPSRRKKSLVQTTVVNGIHVVNLPENSAAVDSEHVERLLEDEPQ